MVTAWDHKSRSAKRSTRQRLPALPGTGVGHAGPGFGWWQRAARLQQLDGDAVRRADEGHAAVTWRAARLALLRTVGWPILGAPARAALEAALDRLRLAGVTVLTPEDCPALAAVESATTEALQITMGINAWEWRWPLGSFVARDASVLSSSALERHARSHAMTQAEYAALLARREAARAAYAALAGQVDAVISVTATGAAPVGLETTGNPIFRHARLHAGAPGVSLPVLERWRPAAGVAGAGLPARRCQGVRGGGMDRGRVAQVGAGVRTAEPRHADLHGQPGRYKSRPERRKPATPIPIRRTTSSGGKQPFRRT